MPIGVYKRVKPPSDKQRATQFQKGHSVNRSHGKCRKVPEYTNWIAMNDRCNNPKNTKYPNYGGRGITICERWKSFENFYADMGTRPTSKHSIERKDTNGNYEPTNCRWATATEQARNTRANRNITAFGRTQCLAAWCDEFGIKYALVSRRLKRGWSTEKALTL